MLTRTAGVHRVTRVEQGGQPRTATVHCDTSPVHAFDPAGRELDAEFSIEPSGELWELAVESRNGMGRNPDYQTLLDLILGRLAQLGAVIEDAAVDSARVQHIPWRDRRIVESPIRLASEPDLLDVRRRLGRAQSRVAQAPGASGGNSTRRIRIRLAIPGIGASDAETLRTKLAQPPDAKVEVDEAFLLDAADLLRNLIGVPLETVDGAVNLVLGVRDRVVVVGTGRSPDGRPVPIDEVELGLRLLRENGRLEVHPDTLGYRSAFVGAVLRTLPGVSLTREASPPVLALHREADRTEGRGAELLPGDGIRDPFHGDLHNAVSLLQRGEQRALRRVLLWGRTEAECALCGDVFPARFLWASHIKRRSVCSDDELRDIPHVAMLACVFGCDALFEDGYISVADGVLIGTGSAPEGPIGRRVAELQGRVVPSWESSSAYFEWHLANVYRG